MLAGADVQGMPRHKPIEAMSNCDRGLAIFRDARRTVLTQQMRAAEDTEFQEELLQLRNTAREDPVPISLLESLREVSDADVAEHPPWAFATIAVLSNYERHHLNRKQAEAFARAHSLPIVMWRLPLTGRAAELLDDLMLHDLYENEPGLWGVFVRGAPAMLTANIQPTKFLVNGACGYMHSLSFPDEAPEVLVTEASGLGFRRVVLEEPPLTVNFQLSLPDGDDGAGIETLVDGYVVVPIVKSHHAETHDTASLWACMKCVPKTLRFHKHPVDLSFAVTDFKLQGKTLDELILSIAPRPFLPRLDLKGFYVMVSRVRMRKRLRVLHKPARAKGALDLLAKMRHTAELSAWDASYDASGDWTPTRSRNDAAPTERAVTVKRRRMAKGPE